MLSVKKAPVDGKTVIVRADFDVPIENGKITETLRIEKSIPTLKYLREKNCPLFIISHLGRPEGRDLGVQFKDRFTGIGKVTR